MLTKTATGGFSDFEIEIERERERISKTRKGSMIRVDKRNIKMELEEQWTEK